MKESALIQQRPSDPPTALLESSLVVRAADYWGRRVQTVVSPLGACLL